MDKRLSRAEKLFLKKSIFIFTAITTTKLHILQTALRSVRPDLAKFCQTMLSIFEDCLILGKILNLPWQINYAIWQIFIAVKDQILSE